MWRFKNGLYGYRGGICTAAFGGRNGSIRKSFCVRNNLLSGQKKPLESMHIIERSSDRR